MDSQSGSRSASPSSTHSHFLVSGPSSEHKWTSFEIRALICLIIKGAHYDRKGPVDPMDFADKLNRALNPVRPSTQGAKALFDRDIPVDAVQRMLRRMLAKRSHAVNIVQRDRAAAVTKRQINAFVRQLDFEGGEHEWLDTYRRGKVMAERAEMRRQLDNRVQGRPISPERWEDSQERLRDIQSPRAQRLLSDWGMGRTFFEGEIYEQCGHWTQADRPSRATGPERTVGAPTRGRSPTYRDRSTSPGRRGSASPGEITHTLSALSTNDAGKATYHHYGPFVAHDKNRGINGISAWDNSINVSTPVWGATGNSLSHLAATLNPPVSGWGGGFAAQPESTPQLYDGGYARGYGCAATPSMHGPAETTADNYGYGVAQGAPAHGGAYATAAGINHSTKPGSNNMPL